MIASCLSVIALISSITITGIIMNVAQKEGGSVNIVEALFQPKVYEEPDEVTNYLTVDGQDQQARVYVPDNGAKNAPVAMYIHGGGWYGGTAEVNDLTARAMADMGFYVVNVDYRLATADYATWDKSPKDVACALTWTVKKATAAGADPTRLTVVGDSAGGHMSMLLGWSASKDAAESSCPDEGPVPVPDAVIAGYPVSDLTYTYDNGTAPTGVDPQVFTRMFLGGSVTEQPERLKVVSPLTYASDKTPPTLIMQPEGDDFIPAEGNYRTANSAKALGVDIRVVRIPFSYHGYDAAPQSLGGQLKNSVILNWLESKNVAP